MSSNLTDALEAERDTLHAAWMELKADNQRLRKGIQDYLDGNYGVRLPRKIDKCPHGQFGYESCEGCIDEYFSKLLAE